MSAGHTLSVWVSKPRVSEAVQQVFVSVLSDYGVNVTRVVVYTFWQVRKEISYVLFSLGLLDISLLAYEIGNNKGFEVALPMCV